MGPEFLEIASLRLTLTPAPTGPIVSCDDDAFDALCWILQGASAMDEHRDDELFAAIQSGTEWYHPIMQMRPPGPDDDLEGARATWHRLTGTELTGELRVLEVGGKTPSILPLGALRELSKQLRELVRDHACDPPWLFAPDAQWDTAHSTEYARIKALEHRLADDAMKTDPEIAALGLDSPTRARSKLQHLLRWDMPTLAKLYIDRVQAWQCLDLPEPPWLFAEVPHGEFPHPSEPALLRELEAEASAVASAEQELGGAEEPEALILRRANLLQRLKRHGFHSELRRDEKARTLRSKNCPTLALEYKATLELLEYLRSSARSRYNPESAEVAVLDCAVCVDAFKNVIAPKGVSRFAWISWGESLLRTHGPGPDVRSMTGQFPYHDQDGLIWVFWRKDAEAPALRHVVLQSD